MSARLDAAIRKLTEEQREMLARYAEALAEEGLAQAASDPAGDDAPRYLRMTWAGALRDEPERSGVEAQATALREWMESLERGMPK
jgi:hypothetical protein